MSPTWKRKAIQCQRLGAIWAEESRRLRECPGPRDQGLAVTYQALSAWHYRDARAWMGIG